MKKEKTAKLTVLLALCLSCLWLWGGRAEAAEVSSPAGTEEPAGTSEPGSRDEDRPKISYEAGLRIDMKARGKYFGKAGNCYYTYTNHNKEIKIIGFRESARKITIPEKIKGKKVTVLTVKEPELIPNGSGDYDLVDVDWSRYKSKTKCIVIPRYVRKMDVSFLVRYPGGEYRPIEKLEEYRVSPKNRHFMSKDGVIFDKKGKTLVCYPDRKKGASYRIPKGVVKVGDYAFYETVVKKISMPGTLRTIGESAFGRTKITNVVFPKGLKTIKSYAFESSSLRECTIPGSVKSVPKGCFLLCEKLRKVTIGSGVQKIRSCAFSKCKKLRKVIIPPSVKDIDGDAFVYVDVDNWREDKLNVTVYAKKGSYAYKKYKTNEKLWRESEGVKVKAM